MLLFFRYYITDFWKTYFQNYSNYGNTKKHKNQNIYFFGTSYNLKSIIHIYCLANYIYFKTYSY